MGLEELRAGACALAVRVRGHDRGLTQGREVTAQEGSTDDPGWIAGVFFSLWTVTTPAQGISKSVLGDSAHGQAHGFRREGLLT